MASRWSAELKNGDDRIPSAECFHCHPEAMGAMEVTLLAFVCFKSQVLAGFSEATYCEVAQYFRKRTNEIMKKLSVNYIYILLIFKI
ncbi:hypothetical protein KC19_2G190800 [Ceratodon purpureus]|uniref:Uncharacterized protein n=1 Tax=Ceratodon purpureus TaxID=3225 RepID=A0A8T0IY04_CERPU|nr:hypothetical protein KC19_2G190800 [Ceratodon purpureus]